MSWGADEARWGREEDDLNSGHVDIAASVKHPHRAILYMTGCIITKPRRESSGLHIQLWEPPAQRVYKLFHNANGQIIKMSSFTPLGPLFPASSTIQEPQWFIQMKREKIHFMIYVARALGVWVCCRKDCSPHIHRPDMVLGYRAATAAHKKAVHAKVSTILWGRECTWPSLAPMPSTVSAAPDLDPHLLFQPALPKLPCVRACSDTHSSQ